MTQEQHPEDQGINKPDTQDSSEASTQRNDNTTIPEQSASIPAKPEHPFAPPVPNTPPVPNIRQDDPELEQEIQEALGDLSLVELYGNGSSETPMGDKPRQESTAEGIRFGSVVSVDTTGLFIDMGGKSQGFLPSEELEEGESCKVGDQVQVAVVGYDQRDGLILLSKKTADQQLLLSNLKEGDRVEAIVTGTNKGGLELTIKGLSAFMPLSQIDVIRITEPESLIGQKMICEVTDVEHGDKNIVLSRRNVLLAAEAEQREKTLAELEVGQLRHGVVRGLMDFGAFVNLGGVDGLIHISEMSWARIKHPSEILSEGQGVDVLVTEIDREKNRIALSLRKAGGDPWSTVEQNYPVGTRHQAQIRNLADFGAFAELEPGVDGLIPISEMTWAGRIRHPSDVVKQGAMVEVEILKLDPDKRRMSLSMKQVQQNPWDNVSEKYVVDGKYTGTVAMVTDFGAFVTLEQGIDGLVHISQLSDSHVRRTSDIVSQGQEVTVKVVSIDIDNQRIALSMKEDGSAAKQEDTKATRNEAPAKQKKKRPRRGGLDR